MKTVLIPPISTRLHEGFLSKNSWLANYYEFRNYLQDSPTLKLEAKKFLSYIGKNNSDLADKFRGTLLGLAIGDALGTTLEFSERNEAESHTTITGGGPFNLKPGQWTDDTSMALCLAHSLFERNCFDPDHQMELYVQWWQEGFLSSTYQCFDIGNTVLDALTKYTATKNPYSGSTDEHSAGNGALMRLAPVPLFFASNPANAIELSGQSSKTTHGNILSIDACRYFSGLILGALLGDTKENILSDLYSPQSGHWNNFPLCDKVSEIAKGSFKNKKRDEIKSTGYVIASLEAALWAFYNSDSFEQGLIKAVNLGGDADSIGAIYGQLAGAYYGELGIPFRFIKPLKNYHYFYFFADEFVTFYTGRKELLECGKKLTK